MCIPAPPQSYVWQDTDTQTGNHATQTRVRPTCGHTQHRASALNPMQLQRKVADPNWDGDPHTTLGQRAAARHKPLRGAFPPRASSASVNHPGQNRSRQLQHIKMVATYQDEPHNLRHVSSEPCARDNRRLHDLVCAVGTLLDLRERGLPA